MRWQPLDWHPKHKKACVCVWRQARLEGWVWHEGLFCAVTLTSYLHSDASHSHTEWFHFQSCGKFRSLSPSCFFLLLYLFFSPGLSLCLSFSIFFFLPKLGFSVKTKLYLQRGNKSGEEEWGWGVLAPIWGLAGNLWHETLTCHTWMLVLFYMMAILLSWLGVVPNTAWIICPENECPDLTSDWLWHWRPRTFVHSSGLKACIAKLFLQCTKALLESSHTSAKLSHNNNVAVACEKILQNWKKCFFYPPPLFFFFSIYWFVLACSTFQRVCRENAPSWKIPSDPFRVLGQN